MPRTIESQREGRATEGHPYRLQMIAWNNSEAGKYAQRKYKQTDAYKQLAQEEGSVGGKNYERLRTVRVASRKAANKSGEKWTAHQIEELQKLLVAGYTCKEIGLVLQRSLQAIERKKSRLGRSCDQVDTTTSELR